jgi:hypothetical protein
MSSDAFWDRMAEVDKALGREPTSAAERARTNAMADQIVTVTEAVAQWDSPGLYEIEGAHQRCLAVLKAHRFIGTRNVTYQAMRWDLMPGNDADVIELPPFDPDDINHASVPRVIFAARPRSVRICRGTVYDSLAGVLLSIAAKPSWRCDWGVYTGDDVKLPEPHVIRPIVYEDPETGKHEVTHSKPYLMTKAMGDYLLVFVVCTQCLEDLISRGADTYAYGPNTRDRELIDSRWRPRFFNPRKVWMPNGGGNPVRVTRWDSSDELYPSDAFSPAAYLMNGIRFVVPFRFSQWREDDSKTYDNFPD